MALAASPPPLGVAQERGRAASPDELWQDYPLRPDETAGATAPGRAPPGADGSGDASSKPSSSGSDEVVSGTVMIVLLVLLVIPLVALLALLAPWRLLPRARARKTSPDRPVAGPLHIVPPLPSPTWTDLRTSTWTAEIQWHSGAGASRFCVVASPPGGAKEVTLVESPPVEWPPSSDAALKSLVGAVEDLERSAVAAGWEPTERGGSWFARRFAWPRTDRSPRPTLERAPAPSAKRA
jgi:hypothetical protein